MRFLATIIFLLIFLLFSILFMKFTNPFVSGILSMGCLLIIIYTLGKIGDFYWSKKKIKATNEVRNSILINFLIGMHFLQKNENFEEWKNTHIDKLSVISEKCNTPLDDFLNLSSLDHDFLNNFNKDIELKLLIEDFIHNSSFDLFNDLNTFDYDSNFNNLYDFIDYYSLNNSNFNEYIGNEISINTATGLPIIGNSGIDVGGNPDGVDLLHHSFDDHNIMNNTHDYGSSSFDDFNKF